MAELKIVFPVHGDILSRHDGDETPAGLKVLVKGRCARGASVTVGQAAANVRDGTFEAEALLKDHENVVTATSGDQRDAATVLYDKKSFPRYRLSVDDVVWCFNEIARRPERYASLLDHWFFAFLRKLHTDFGTHVQMNIYFENPEWAFDLTQFPDRYKAEWQENAHWLRLSFHARGNDCYEGRIYRDTTYPKLKRDYERVVAEIVRFAGESVLCRTYTTVHMADASAEGVRALRDLGIRGLTGRFGVGPAGKPFATRYYLDEDTNRHFHDRNLWRDPAMGVYFVNVPRFLNNVPIKELVPHYDGLLHGEGSRTPYDVIDFLVHEQHFWRGFQAHKPDNMERCVTAATWAAERGLDPVGFEHGIAGNA